MNAKDFLLQYKLIDIEINEKLEEQTRLRNLAAIASPEIGVTVHRIGELEKEINNDIDKLLNVKATIMNAISNMDDEILRLILIMRYINLHKWEYIAEKLNVDMRWLYRLHNKAISKLKGAFIDEK